MLGPFDEPPITQLMYLPVELVPKKTQMNENNYTLKLSLWGSINDFIDESKMLTHYQEFDDAI